MSPAGTPHPSQQNEAEQPPAEQQQQQQFDAALAQQLGRACAKQLRKALASDVEAAGANLQAARQQLQQVLAAGHADSGGEGEAGDATTAAAEVAAEGCQQALLLQGLVQYLQGQQDVLQAWVQLVSKSGKEQPRQGKQQRGGGSGSEGKAKRSRKGGS